MKKQPFSIFRADAVQRYIDSKEKAVLPKFVSPNLVIYLWLLLGIFLIGILLTWWMNIPVYASGTAVVADDKRLQSSEDSSHFVIFLPSNMLHRVHIGQKLFLTVNHTRITKTITEIEHEIISPETAVRRFNLYSLGRTIITNPVMVAYAPLGTMPENLPSHSYRGCTFNADVEAGSRRVISFLPIVGRFF